MNKLINSNKFLTYYVLKIIKLTFSLPFATPGNFTALWKALVFQRNCWNARFKK